MRWILKDGLYYHLVPQIANIDQIRYRPAALCDSTVPTAFTIGAIVNVESERVSQNRFIGLFVGFRGTTGAYRSIEITAGGVGTALGGLDSRTDVILFWISSKKRGDERIAAYVHKFQLDLPRPRYPEITIE